MPLFLVVLSTVLVLAGGPRGRDTTGAGDPEGAALPDAPLPPNLNVNAHPVDEIIDLNKERLLALGGVDGVGHGLTPAGDDAIIVWVSDAAAADRVPTEIDGVPVIVEQVPGGFHAQ
ncbi:hypothetical protein [Cryobacterium fucosi]|uniref:Uncharacterized protein n=1 Tax=Cryobacterium fucosi TaxID=1259157 RepID=A0A4R9B6X1_9MICO|nr:hypothetical protein [Cryobacterium fucosi]TFD75939.1 hypothetical protein E3T48_10955 [Cryobacterium fucosi]